MSRRVSLTYELPDELCAVLEEKAANEGRSFEEVVSDYLSRSRSINRMTSKEAEQRKAAFERHLGAWRSGQPETSRNDAIDTDLAREHSARDSGVR